MLSNRHTHTQTHIHADTQTKYCNPHCACGPRVNKMAVGHCRCLSECTHWTFIWTHQSKLRQIYQILSWQHRILDFTFARPGLHRGASKSRNETKQKPHPQNCKLAHLDQHTSDLYSSYKMLPGVHIYLPVWL